MLTIFIVIVFLCLCGLVTLFTNNSQASKATKVAKAPKII